MRKNIVLTLPDADQSLTFKIKQMPASKLESWMIRAILLLAPCGSELSLSSIDIRLAGDFFSERALSALGLLDYEKAKPLLDELLGCCTRVTESGAEIICSPETVDGFITDVRTLFKLRLEVLKLNLDFLALGEGDPLNSQEKSSTKQPAA